MDDIRAVMDAVGSEKAVLFGHLPKAAESLRSFAGDLILMC